jgi:hypothetical protein
MAKDIAAIEQGMKELHDSLTALSSGSDFDEFFRMIHFPGWTTLIDEYFVQMMIAAMQEQVRSVSAQFESLMTGARMIAEEAKKSG